MAKKIIFDFNNKKKAKRNLKKGLAVGAAVGTTVGALSGLLLAPRSGKDTRGKIKTDATDIAKKAVKTAESVKTAANKAGEVVIEKANELKSHKFLKGNKEAAASKEETSQEETAKNEETTEESEVK